MTTWRKEVCRHDSGGVTLKTAGGVSDASAISDISRDWSGRTLRRQHGSSGLVEVEQLLQEQDGLQDERVALSHYWLYNCCLQFPGRPPRVPRNRRDVVWRCWLWSAMRANTSSAITQPECVCVCVCSYIAGQLMHCSVLGHVVLFVRIILQSEKRRENSIIPPGY